MGKTVLDGKTKVACLVAIYAAGSVEELQSTRRAVANKLVGEYNLAVNARYLLELAAKLPAGLVNDERQMTLQRAANELVGLNKPKAKELSKGGSRRIKGAQRAYTNYELMEAVLSFGAPPCATRHCSRAAPPPALS